jgi:hypothetical protein
VLLANTHLHKDGIPQYNDSVFWLPQAANERRRTIIDTFIKKYFLNFATQLPPAKSFLI